MQNRRALGLAIASLLCVSSPVGRAQQDPALHVQEASTRVTFPGDHFHLALTVKAAAPALAQVTAELVDTQDEVRSSGKASCSLVAGSTVCALDLPPASPDTRRSLNEPDDLPHFRLRYAVSAAEASASGTQALDSIAPDLFTLHLAEPRDIHRGASYIARVRALHPLTNRPRAGVALKATLTAAYAETDKDNETLSETQVVTDADGFASVPFTVPADAALDSVAIEVESAIANLPRGVSTTLSIPRNARFELTTDKPLYQPGQTVHSRLLLLDRNGHASASKTVRLNVEDPNGILVFRAEAVTSNYGIAAIDWTVPARLRLGEYRLWADLPGDSGEQQTAWASIRVSRYDLPTFVVDPKPDRPFYLSGSGPQFATVAVRANYLFGKPVLHGKVRVVREDDRTWNYEKQSYETKEGASVSGELDENGSFSARIPLAADLKRSRGLEPDGNLYNQFEDLSLAAYVTDESTGRTEQRRFDLRVAAQAIQLYVTAGSLAVGLPQPYFLAATTADGAPVQCDIHVALLPEAKDKDTLARRRALAVPLLQLRTDSRGLARLTLPEYESLRKSVPGRAADADEQDKPEVYLSARDVSGQTGALVESLSEPTENLRIATNQSIYRPGDPIEISIDSAHPSLPLTVQVLRRTRQGDLTLATREIRLDRGHAALTIPSDDRFTGYVFVHALAIGVDARGTRAYGDDNDAGDESTSLTSHAILFPRDNALHVGIQMSAESYAPGAEATASLTVKGPQDPDGEIATPAPSALGLAVVDQAVAERNRTDSDFGATNPFFFRWYSDFASQGVAGGLDLPTLERLDPNQPIAPEAQLAAEMLLARLSLNFNSTDNSPSSDLASAFNEWFFQQLQPVRTKLVQMLTARTELPTAKQELAALLAPEGIDLPAFRDPWGMAYTLIAQPDNQGDLALVLRSNGPDKLPGTADDFPVPLASWRWFAERGKQLKQAIAAFHQRTGNFIRTLADLRAEMQAEGVDFEAWRDPWGQPFRYQFAIEQTHYAVTALSAGDPARKSLFPWQRGLWVVGIASIDYTEDLRKRIDAALNTYTVSHPYPGTEAAFWAALKAAGIGPALLVDPWHRPLRVTFRTRSFYTDRIQTEARATPTTAPQTHTTITPVTAIADIVELHSLGPEGKINSPGNFMYASFSRTRSMQSAKDEAPTQAAHQTVHSGETGAISGVVTDPSGALIPNAIVTAISAKTGDVYQTKTDQDGRYVLGPLPVGSYTVRFDAPGFMRLSYEPTQVTRNNTVTLDAQLRIGAVSESVEVSADAPMLETMSASVVSSQQIASLPLRGREASAIMKISAGVAGPEATSTPRLRDYFPETLLWRPEILTAPDGTATVRFPVADSITNWQLAAAASTLEGNTGAGAAEFRTFQPFFAAFDPPSVLTVGDTVALPVTLRNYLDHDLSVRSSIAPASWFRLAASESITTPVASQQSASPIFRFTALAPVSHAKQEFTAQAGETGDRIAREVTVHPDGQESAVTAAAVLAPGENTLTLTLPSDALPGSSDTTLKVYPNLAAHLRDALVAMAKYPNGCAEQTISAAWPSLLLQRYAAAIPQKDEKTQRQTREYLEQAYENLLGNQLASGGFAYWPKDSAADLALTAYAVQFLAAAREFVAVDDRVIANAVVYLARQQSAAKETAGLWVRVDREGKAHPEDVHANAMLTASIAAMIAGAPQAQPVIEKALAATQPFAEEFDEPYTLASYALAALAVKDPARSGSAIQRLRGMALAENGGAYWSLETNTPFFGWGRAGRVETTAQVLRALLAAGATPQDDLVARGLIFLDHQQDRDTLWYSTQATARVLDAMAAIALRTPLAAVAVPGQLRVRVQGQNEILIPLPSAATDAGPIFVPLGGVIGAGANAVKLTLPAGAQSATAQLVANFYQAWPAQPPAEATPNNERLQLTVAYRDANPRPGDPVEVTAHVERIGFEGYGMMIAEIGLPPGADVDRASLESAATASDWQINHYEVLPDKVLLYLWPRAGGITVRFQFALRYGVDALTAPSSVYDYYNPDSRSDVAPTRFRTL